MHCDYCGYVLQTYERILRQDGHYYCRVCIGRLTVELTPTMAEWQDFQPMR